MQPVPYLFFRNNCAEAMRFYAQTFGSGEAQIMTFSDAPKEVLDQMPGVDPGTVMHSALNVGDGWIFASDDPTGEFQPMAGTSVNLSFPTLEEAQRVFAALSEGGEVRMPLSPTFWSAGFGALTDRFGTRWMIMVDTPDSSA
jgi:PhnB protein